MKAFFGLIILTTVSALMLLRFGLKPFSKEMYLDQKVLEMSMPFDVKIDTEFLKGLEPAK